MTNRSKWRVWHDGLTWVAWRNPWRYARFHSWPEAMDFANRAALRDYIGGAA